MVYILLKKGRQNPSP